MNLRNYLTPTFSHTLEKRAVTIPMGMYLDSAVLYGELFSVRSCSPFL